jgi:hypothetical protein
VVTHTTVQKSAHSTLLQNIGYAQYVSQQNNTSPVSRLQFLLKVQDISKSTRATRSIRSKTYQKPKNIIGPTKTLISASSLDEIFLFSAQHTHLSLDDDAHNEGGTAANNRKMYKAVNNDGDQDRKGKNQTQSTIYWMKGTQKTLPHIQEKSNKQDIPNQSHYHDIITSIDPKKRSRLINCRIALEDNRSLRRF